MGRNGWPRLLCSLRSGHCSITGTWATTVGRSGFSSMATAVSTDTSEGIAGAATSRRGSITSNAPAGRISARRLRRFCGVRLLLLAFHGNPRRDSFLDRFPARAAGSQAHAEEKRQREQQDAAPRSGNSTISTTGASSIPQRSPAAIRARR